MRISPGLRVINLNDRTVSGVGFAELSDNGFFQGFRGIIGLVGHDHIEDEIGVCVALYNAEIMERKAAVNPV